MTYIPKVEKWLADARRRKDAAREGSVLEREAIRDIRMYEELLESLHEKHKPQQREPGEDDEQS